MLCKKFFGPKTQKQGCNRGKIVHDDPMPMPRTPEALEALEQAVITAHGDIITAARNLQVSPIDVQQWMASDPEVHQTLENARRLGWAALESEAIRRATGYEEEVWYQGVMVGTTTKYSDSLLQTLLKARVSGHKEDSSAMRAMVQVNIMPRADNYEEWIAQRQVELNRHEHTALPSPPSDEPTIDAEYTELTEVSQEAKDAYSLMRDPDNKLPDWL